MPWHHFKAQLLTLNEGLSKAASDFALEVMLAVTECCRRTMIISKITKATTAMAAKTETPTRAP